MKLTRRILVLILPFLLSSCANIMLNARTEVPDKTEGSRICSSTPKETIANFFEGLKTLNPSLMFGAIKDGMTIFGVFGKGDSKLGEERIKAITEHPVIKEAKRSCVCAPISVVDTDDPNIKLVFVKRISLIPAPSVDEDDDVYESSRSFRVEFTPDSNCIADAEDLDQKWIKM